MVFLRHAEPTSALRARANVAPSAKPRSDRSASTLSPELWSNVFTYLDAPSLVSAGAVSKRWGELARSPAVFAAVVEAGRRMPEPQTHLFFHPDRSVMFHLGRSGTLRTVLLDHGHFVTKALGALVGPVRKRCFSAGGNLVALEASTNGRIDVFDLRREPKSTGAYFRAQLTFDQFVLCGEEPRVLEMDLHCLHEPAADGASQLLTRRSFVARPAHWHSGYTENRASRDGTWMASWKSTQLPPHGGPEFCLFRVVEPQATMRVFGGERHVYGNVAFDPQGQRAAALYLDSQRDEVALYLVDLRTMQRGPDFWTGSGSPIAPWWSLRFSDDGANILLHVPQPSPQGGAQLLWSPVAEEAIARLRPLHAEPGPGTRQVRLSLAGLRQCYYLQESVPA